MRTLVELMSLLQDASVDLGHRLIVKYVSLV